MKGKCRYLTEKLKEMSFSFEGHMWILNRDGREIQIFDKQIEGNIISFKGKFESEIEWKKNTEICNNIDNSVGNWYSEQNTCIGMNLWTARDVKILDNKLVPKKSYQMRFKNLWVYSSNRCMTDHFWRILLFCHLWELVKQCSFSVPFTAKAAKQKFGVGHVICLKLLCQHFNVYIFHVICHLPFMKVLHQISEHYM